MIVQKYRKRNEYIKAIQFTGNNWREIQEYLIENRLIGSYTIYLDSNGNVTCIEIFPYWKRSNWPARIYINDWLIIKENGDIENCRDYLFEELYVKEEP